MAKILSDFLGDVRQRLVDLRATSRYSDTLISGLLDRWITRNWGNIVNRLPRYYYTVDNAFNGVIDQELYPLPDDFRSAGVLRRSNVIEKPRLKFIDPFNQNMYRLLNPPYIERDALAPNHSIESWSMVGNSIKILPTPASSSYEYALEYFRQQVPASLPGDTIDFPFEFYPLAVDETVQECLIVMEPDNKGAREGADQLMSKSLKMSQQVTPMETLGQVPEAITFWGGLI